MSDKFAVTKERLADYAWRMIDSWTKNQRMVGYLAFLPKEEKIQKRGRDNFHAGIPKSSRNWSINSVSMKTDTSISIKPTLGHLGSVLLENEREHTTEWENNNSDL